jgi:Pyruvate/2-oxoacid:ferredoxin oxidoreductase delta subunit
MLNNDGIPTPEQVKNRFPEDGVLIKPKAIIECYEKIPCNPCETSCPFKAITIGEDINNVPVINHDLCTGCAICVHSCPGLAIMVAQIMDNKALFKIPYEMLPLPEIGEIWDGVDRSGTIICQAKIIKIDSGKNQNQTNVIHIETDMKHLYDFITIRCPYE